MGHVFFIFSSHSTTNQSNDVHDESFANSIMIHGFCVKNFQASKLILDSHPCMKNVRALKRDVYSRVFFCLSKVSWFSSVECQFKWECCWNILLTTFLLLKNTHQVINKRASSLINFPFSLAIKLFTIFVRFLYWWWWWWFCWKLYMIT